MSEAPHHRKLWLWRNFVDGVPEYWAFGNAYPCRLGGGDPLVLGEPCGYALHIESSVGRDYDDDEVLAAVMRANESQRDVELSALRARAERAEAELEKMTKERDAACDAANEFLENNRHLRANWAGDVKKLIAAEDARGKALEMANALYNAFVAHESNWAISHKIADLIEFLESSEQGSNQQ